MSNETKHTPGPCRCTAWEDDDVGGTVIVYCPAHAAAPALLAALRDVCSLAFAHAEPGDELAEAIVSARAAIAQAEGKVG